MGRRRFPPSGKRDLLADASVERVYPDMWTDVFGTLDQATGVGSLTFEQVLDTPASTYWFRRDQNDAITLKYQMPHGWNLGGVRPHVHIMPAGETAGNLVFDGYYTWTGVGTGLVMPSLSGWTPYTSIHAITVADKYQELAVALASIIPPEAARKPSATLWMHVRRPGVASASDTYDGNKLSGTAAANVGLVFMDTHYQLAKFGTVSEYGPT